VTAAANQLGMAPSTLLRWLSAAVVAGEQFTLGGHANRSPDARITLRRRQARPSTRCPR
jgi:hypothetical protein